MNNPSDTIHESIKINQELRDYDVIKKMFIIIDKNNITLDCPDFFKDVMGDFKLDS